MQLVSFVIPCYRSEHTICSVVDEVRRTMPTLPDYDYELILVNDCSPDGTFAVLRTLAEEDGRVTAVDLAKNFGQHAALMAGFHHCAGDIVVCLDDDGQTPADEVGKLLSKLEEGYALAVSDIIEEEIGRPDALVAVVVVSPERIDAAVDDALVEIDDIGCGGSLLCLVGSGSEDVSVDHGITVDHRGIEGVGEIPDRPAVGPEGLGG